MPSRTASARKFGICSRGNRLTGCTYVQISSVLLYERCATSYAIHNIGNARDGGAVIDRVRALDLLAAFHISARDQSAREVFTARPGSLGYAI